MEILRRYYAGLVDRAKGKCGDEVVRKLELVMQQAQVTPALCPAVQAALDRYRRDRRCPPGAMQLPDGRLVTGKTSSARPRRPQCCSTP